MPPHASPAPSHPPAAASHTLIEDVQAIVIGCLFVALSIVMLRESRLLTGGSAGLSFIVHYLTGWRFGLVLFFINLPFYIFGLRALGRRFTVKTFCAVGVLSLLAETLPKLGVVALGVVVGFPLLTALALRHVSSAHSIVFLGLLPLCTAVFAVLRGGERPRPTFWLFSVLGSAFVAGYAALGGIEASLRGDVLMLAAIVVCGRQLRSGR